jgi:guanine nucleotide-binding protein subunit beta-2-like 1 protein
VNFQPYFASVGWDGRIKVWNTNFQIRYTFKHAECCFNAVAISPNGKFLATGGNDKQLNIWPITDMSAPVRVFEAGSTIN